MKKIFSYAMAAALVFGLASCAKEIDNGGADTTGPSAMQFTVKTSQGNYVTYAEIAENDEWKINAVDLYLFDSAGAKIDYTSGSDFTMDDSTPGQITFTAADTWLAAHKGETIKAYFVANDATANLFGNSGHVDKTYADEAALLAQHTVKQTLDATDNNRANHLTTPLLFSMATETVVPAVGKVSVDVKLKRREARFDIVNNMLADVTIDGVIVKNANIEGYIFADGAGAPTMAKADMKQYGAKTYDATDVNRMKHVFYLYPTQLGAGNTEISVLATVGGVQAPYPVNSTATIDANKRYTLVLAKNPAGLQFVVVADDYDEDIELPVESLKKLSASNFSLGAGSGILANGGYMVKNDGVASTITFDLYASSKDGVNISAFETLNGTAPVVTATSVTENTITYSNIGYKTTVTVNVGAYNGTDNFDGKITFSDKKNPEAKMDFFVLHVDNANLPATESVLLGTITSEIYKNSAFSVNANNGGTIEVPIISVYGTTADITFTDNVGSTLTYTTNLAQIDKEIVITNDNSTYQTVEKYIFSLPVTQNASDGPFDFTIKFSATSDPTKNNSVRVVRAQASKAVENILAYDPVRGLNLDGVGATLYFKWGSLIGTDAHKANEDTFSADDILFTPATFGGTITNWASIPYGNDVDYPNAMPALNEVAGLGDPCRLASKGGVGNDVGKYRMATGNPYEGLSGNGALGTINDIIGRGWGEQFFPFNGYRDQANDGMVTLVGQRGMYWSSTANPDGEESAYCLSITTGTVRLTHYATRSAGMPVRCVAAE